MSLQYAVYVSYVNSIHGPKTTAKAVFLGGLKRSTSEIPFKNPKMSNVFCQIICPWCPLCFFKHSFPLSFPPENVPTVWCNASNLYNLEYRSSNITTWLNFSDCPTMIFLYHPFHLLDHTLGPYEWYRKETVQAFVCIYSMFCCNKLAWTGLRSGGFLVQAPVPTNHGRYSSSRYQNNFRALPRCPWARCRTPKCSHRVLDELVTHFGGGPCLHPYSAMTGSSTPPVTLEDSDQEKEWKKMSLTGSEAKLQGVACWNTWVYNTCV